MKKRTMIIAASAVAASVGLAGGLAAVESTPGGAALSQLAKNGALTHVRGGDHHRRGRGMAGRLCDPRRDAVVAAGIAYVDTAMDFTPEQTAAFDTLSTSLTEASIKVGEACEARAETNPETSVERLMHLEEGLGDALAIVQDVRPAYDAFYATLTATQREQLEKMMPRRGFGGGKGWHRGGRDRHDRGGRHGRFDRDDADDSDES